VIRRRPLLLAAAALLVASGLLAVGILLFGGFGETEGRVLATTALLAGFAVLAIPSTPLLERGSRRSLPLALLAACVVGAATGVAAIWGDSETLWQVTATSAVLGGLAAQTGGLVLRRRATDPPVVRRLLWAATLLGAAVAGMVIALVWSDGGGPGFARALAALIVLDAVAVALAPLLARARRAGAEADVVLRLVLDPGGTEQVRARGADVAGAVAAAIRAAEARGTRVTRVDIVGR
jgi:hypothetical protein